MPTILFLGLILCGILSDIDICLRSPGVNLIKFMNCIIISTIEVVVHVFICIQYVLFLRINSFSRLEI